MEKNQDQNPPPPERGPADRERSAGSADFAAEMKSLLLEIQGCVSLLLGEIEAADPGYDKLLRIQEQARRGLSLIGGFHRPPSLTGADDIPTASLAVPPPPARETILLVDDERTIIDVTRDMLETFGYHVLASQSGQDAIRICQDQAGRIDLVILDMILPDMNGEEIFALIKAIRPDMPIILASGFSFNDQIGRIMARGCDAFLQKPFGLSELTGKVREVLDRDGEAP